MAAKQIHIEDTDGEGGYRIFANVYYYELNNKGEEKYPKTAISWDQITMDVEDGADSGKKLADTTKETIREYIKESILVAPKDMPDSLSFNLDSAYLQEGVVFKRSAKGGVLTADGNITSSWAEVLVGSNCQVFGTEKNKTQIGFGVEISQYSRVSSGCEIGDNVYIDASIVEPNTTLDESAELVNSEIGAYATIGKFAKIHNKMIPNFCEVPSYYNAAAYELKPGELVNVLLNGLYNRGQIQRVSYKQNGEYGYEILMEDGSISIVSMEKVEPINIIKHSNVPDYLKGLFQINFYSDMDFFTKYITIPESVKNN